MRSDEQRDSAPPAEESPAGDAAASPLTAQTDTTHDGASDREIPSPRARRPHLSEAENTFPPRPHINFADQSRSYTLTTEGTLSPEAADRVFPIRSVISVDPTPTPSTKPEKHEGSYFQSTVPTRKWSRNTSDTLYSPAKPLYGTDEPPMSPQEIVSSGGVSKQGSTSNTVESMLGAPQQQYTQTIKDIVSQTDSMDDGTSTIASERPTSTRVASFKSATSHPDDTGELVTARFRHVVTEDGYAVITGRDGGFPQRCEDEPIHIPGAVQGFGLLVALEEQQEGKLLVRVASENSNQIIGFSPSQLFALNSFTDILSEEQTDNLLDHIDFIRDDDADIVTNGPEVFTMSVRTPSRKNRKLWCAIHINERNPNLIICEFELEDDSVNPLVPPNEVTPEPPEDTLNSQPTEAELQESTQNNSKPLRVLRSARKRKGEAAAMEVFNIMSQVQEQLAAAPNLDMFLKILVGVVKELTGFHRVMIYQFDQSWNGRVVTELVDPRATKDLYKGLNFPASDIPKQARDLYKLNKVRMLYDRDQETARLVCRTVEDLETPLDLTHSYLRAMSPIHLKYLANMAVRSSMSISVNAFEELWGLIACHSYGSKGMRVSFPIRKMCRLVGDTASRNIERLSYASRLQARKLINTVPTQSNPSGYIVASSEDLLKLFDADFGLLSIRDETKILGKLEQSQEALAMLEYLRMRGITNVMTSMDIKQDFPDLRYPPGFSVIAGLLIVPLSVGGQDFIVFFRKGQLKEVKWAGNPYEKTIREGTDAYLEPRKSFRTWSETVVGKCREWTEEEIETAAVLCLVYGKFIEVWRQKEAALQNSQLTRLLLANSAHEVRTPLNAIINYLEIALEGSLDQETRDNLAKSHSASKSLIYVINDLLDLTKTEEGGELVKDEVFDLKITLLEATDAFKSEARRKNIYFEVVDVPGLPSFVTGDQRRVRQAISNVTANAIQNTAEGGVRVEMQLVSQQGTRCEVEISISDTGIGIDSKKLDQLFRELEQVQTEGDDLLLMNTNALPSPTKKGDDRVLGLGLAMVARIIRNSNGQLRLKSEEGKGSRFVIQFPFDLPDSESTVQIDQADPSAGSITPPANDVVTPATPPDDGEVTLIERGSGIGRSLNEPGQADISRKNSTDSIGSHLSLGSMKSGRSNLSRSSALSGKSEADRLIEAIQEPHRVDGIQRSLSGRKPTQKLPASSHGNSGLSTDTRPVLQTRHTTIGTEISASLSSGHSKTSDITPTLQRLDTINVDRPGEHTVTDQGVPIRAVRMPEEFGSPTTSTHTRSSSSTFITAANSRALDGESATTSQSQALPNSLSTDHMCVLVAEDDPVNSRIIKKRLEKSGHEVSLTVNGEDCASMYCEKGGFFDIVLMDMQMPIMDGLTSTKTVRSFEKSHPTHSLSARASLNHRVPIIAVSASLVERERHNYIEAGFDGWILKPISFNRLSEIMRGIVDQQSRRENLYRPGGWEYGGWFNEAQGGTFAANTHSSEEPPTAAGEKAAGLSESVSTVAASDDPFVGGAGSGGSQEPKRLSETRG